MNQEFILAVEALEKEKDISKDTLIDAIEQALVSAYKKNYSNSQNVRVNIDRVTGDIDVYMRKIVVSDEDVMDEYGELTLDEAHEIDPKYQLGDVIENRVTPRDFGRIAAQTAKQVVVQRIREAERGMIYDDYSNRQGEIITGEVQRISNETVFINMGKTEGILAVTEQARGEHYDINSRLKVYIMDVKKTTKGPQVYLSRSHPGLVKRLFELEVPEIREGIVEIKSISREAGSRTKIAVSTNDPDVDAVGSCVGPRGSRVQAVVDELFGEKIDIINWSDQPDELIKSALSPAKVEQVFINSAEQSALAIVPDYQLSLAIGKEGQNVRLAAKLCGWKIDIKSHTQFEEQGIPWDLESQAEEDGGIVEVEESQAEENDEIVEVEESQAEEDDGIVEVEESQAEENDEIIEVEESQAEEDDGIVEVEESQAEENDEIIEVEESQAEEDDGIVEIEEAQEEETDGIGEL
ncbi:MAG: transcription termination/antitermination protein NusA [Firmicutes bacterium]|nr:transcription termination/antitermination protein NusA [Bacillota bacterium]